MSRPIPPEGYAFGRLNVSIHVRGAFDCETEALNNFLKTQAAQAQEKDLSSTHVLVVEGNSIAGYVTLRTADLPCASLPDDLAKKYPKNQPIPALLLARMAVDRNHKGKGLGLFLLKFAFMEAIEQADRGGCAFLFVDPKDEAARSFYLKYDFRPLPVHLTRLVIAVSTLRKAMEQADSN